MKANGIKSKVINWPEWLNTGMSEGKNTNSAKELFEVMSPNKGIYYLQNILMRDIDKVIPGKINDKSELYEILEYLPVTFSESIKKVFLKMEKVRKSESNPERLSGTVVALKGGSGIYTRFEHLIGNVLSEVLGYKELDVSDIFFELGMDSIIAVRVINRISENIGIKIGIPDIFQYCNISKLAAFIEKIYLTKELNIEEHSQVKVVEEMESYPVSSAQKRIYALQMVHKNNTAYNLQECLIIEGQLVTARIEKAFTDLISRHDAFRTSFEIIKGHVVQRVHKKVEFKMNYLKLDPAVTQNIDRIVESFIMPFDLASPPLLRGMLVRLGSDRHLLLYDMHHIVTDGVSRGIIISDLFKLYKGEELPEQLIQYKDFAVWQHNFLKSGRMKRQRGFWMNMFQGDIPVLKLKTDYLRPQEMLFEGAVHSFGTDNIQTGKLRKFAQESNVTCSMVLLSVFYIILFKYSGQEDIIVGLPIEGRREKAVEKVVGFFVNTLALRNCPFGNKTFMEFLNEIKDSLLLAYENQDYPLNELLDDIRYIRKNNRNPLYDAMFVFQNSTKTDLDVHNLTLSSYGIVTNVSKIDLELEVMESKERLYFNLHYSTELFKEKTIKRFAEHYILVLEKVLSDNNTFLTDIELMMLQEEDHLRKQLNQNAIDLKIEFDI